MNASSPTKAKVLRCAIYTRKSSEEGLEQSFNSLHAQREACEAYIKSQAHEGWICLPDTYDDGGFSGGSMERPALTALLGDIARGHVDVVVVYKVDRLTRSLMDFAKIVEAFDARGVSFVSITQAFNTTSSMGRLTLNVLLSFAQYEREVTGERIRDKIAASKAKGMWMGGGLPLGYDAKDRTLVINEAEAEQIRFIFRRYLELGSVDDLCAELNQLGYRSKVRTAANGNVSGGVPIGRGPLYHLLQNPTYRGLIPHKDKTHPGLHEAIIEPALFDAVQERLQANRVERRERPTRAATSRLVGRIFDAGGAPMSPSFGYGRGGKLYRYYVASPLMTGGKPVEGEPQRLPADQLEAFILDQLRRLSARPDDDWAGLDPTLLRIEARRAEVHLLLDAEPLFGGDHPDLALEDLRARLAPGERALVEPGEATRLRIVLPIQLVFRGGRSWILDGDGKAVRRLKRQDLALMRALKKAHAILAREGLDPEATTPPKAKAPINDYERKLCTLGLLAPSIQRMILDGRQPDGLSLQTLINATPPLAWNDQEAWLDQLCRSDAGGGAVLRD